MVLKRGQGRGAALGFCCSRQRRRGSLYISVMGVAFIVSVIALSAMHVARLQLKAAVSDGDRYRARLLAKSAIEHAITEFNTNPNWQTDYAFDTEYPATLPAVNGGEFAWSLADLGNSQRRLDGIGRVGAAEAVFSVNLGASGDNYLERGLVCGGNITVGEFSTVEDLTVVGAPIHAAGVFNNNWGNITGDIEAQAINNNSGTIVGTQTAPATACALPDSDTVFDYYITKGSVIATANVQDSLLSPSNNPFGPNNPDGIYVIDAGGFSVSLKRSRIVGTLVVLNASVVSIDEEMNWEPARPNFPCLLVQGDLAFRLTNNSIAESAIGVNLNPPLTPFQGETDSSLDDQYPSGIVGITYCTGNLLLDGKNDVFTSPFFGVVIAGGSCTVVKQADVRITYRPVHLNDPPPGFGSGGAKSIVNGSWRRTPSN